MPIPRGYSAFSSGPIMDTTPHDDDCHIPITDSPFQMTPFGPPYQMNMDSDSTDIENKKD